jgi:hypothetical protein
MALVIGSRLIIFFVHPCEMAWMLVQIMHVVAVKECAKATLITFSVFFFYNSERTLCMFRSKILLLLRVAHGMSTVCAEVVLPL